MKWLATALALVAVIPRGTNIAECQCFTDEDRFHFVVNTDLSNIADFGLDLLEQVVSLEPSENVFISPYSIWSALNLAYFGSAGETEEQLRKALRIQDKMASMKSWKALEFTYDFRSKVPSNYIFNLANRIYVDTRLSFRKCAEVILEKEVQYIDFRNEQSAADEINGFVSNTTGGNIKKLFDPSSLTDAMMVLVNAAYFKGVWQYQFKASQTKSAVFKSDQLEKKVKMMNLQNKLRYGEDEDLGVRLLELPYSGKIVSMYILLPKTPGDEAFESIVQNLNGSRIMEAMETMTLENVKVKLPKFTLETKLEDELTKALKNMGIVDLFDRKVGNLTKYVEGVHQSVDKVAHRAFIEVSEEGTEAAAATGFVIATRVGIMVPNKVVEFHCDRPFIFYLFDNDTRNILFLGAFRAPK